MKISVTLTDAQIAGTKNYLREVDGISNPTDIDVMNEWTSRFNMTMEDSKEAISGYISDIEKSKFEETAIQIANGTHKQFIIENDRVMCKCGFHAEKWGNGYLCSGITINSGCKY